MYGRLAITEENEMHKQFRCNVRHIRPAHTLVYPSHGQGPVDD